MAFSLLVSIFTHYYAKKFNEKMLLRQINMTEILKLALDEKYPELSRKGFLWAIGKYGCYVRLRYPDHLAKFEENERDNIVKRRKKRQSLMGTVIEKKILQEKLVTYGLSNTIKSEQSPSKISKKKSINSLEKVLTPLKSIKEVQEMLKSKRTFSKRGSINGSSYISIKNSNRD